MFTLIDEHETFNTPVAAATSFLFSMVGNRAKTTFMPVLTFLGNVFQSSVLLFLRFLWRLLTEL